MPNIDPWEEAIAAAQSQNKQQSSTGGEVVQAQQAAPAEVDPWEAAIADVQKAKTPPPLTPAQEKQSTFMDMVDVFNNASRRFANGELQALAKGASYLGFDTKNFQNRLRQDTLQHQQMADDASARSPYAAIPAGMLGGLANTIQASAQLGGYGLAHAAPTALGRVGQNVGLAMAEGAAEYGDTTQRATKAALSGTMAGIMGGAIEGAGAAKGLLQQAKKGIDEAGGAPLTMGQATGNKAIQNAEAYLASVPVIGARGNVNKAADDLTNQAKGLLDEQGVHVGDHGIEGVDRGALAQSLKDDIFNAKKTASQNASAVYQGAKELAKEGDIKVPLTNAAKIADDVLENKLAKEGFTAADINKLPEVEHLKNFSDNRLVSGEGFEDLRGTISNIAHKYKTAGDEKLAGLFKTLRQGMDKDLDAASKANAGAWGQKIQQARKQWEDTVAPFNDNPVLKKALANKDPDTILTQAISNEHPALAKTLMQHLSDEGKQTLTTAMLNEAATKSIKAGSNEFSASMFNDQLRKLGGTLQALPEELQHSISGLRKVLSEGNYLLKASEGGVAKTLGGAAGGALAGGGLAAFGGAGPAIAGGAAVKTISSLLTNPKAVNILAKVGGGDLSATLGGRMLTNLTKKALGYKVGKEVAPVFQRALRPAIAEYVGGYLNNQLK